MAKKEIVVIGVSRFSTALINRLNEFSEYSIVAIDKDDKKLETLQGVKSLIVGDATVEGFLSEVGIENSDYYIIGLGNDFQSSLIIASILNNKEIFKGKIIALSVSEQQEKILYDLGIKNVINPEEAAAKRAFNKIANPLSGITKNDEISEIGGGVSVMRIPVTERFLDKKVSEAELPRGIIISLIYRDGKASVVTGDTVFEKGYEMSIMGEEKALVKFVNNEIHPEVDVEEKEAE
jgi:trk system potassium uptake protein